MKGYINGKEVDFKENETILQTATAYGHFIPTLCALPCLNHTPGTCRVCLVDIKRKGKYRPSDSNKLRYPYGRRHGGAYPHKACT